MNYESKLKKALSDFQSVVVRNQGEADAYIPALLESGGKHVVICEPLLGPVDLAYTCFNGADSFGQMPGIDWVIVGGESGAKARPMHPDWVRSIRDQCQSACVPFFFRQWGEWTIGDYVETEKGIRCAWLKHNGEFFYGWESGDCEHWDNPPDMYCIGKKAVGRLLDGREWNEFPEVEK